MPFQTHDQLPPNPSVKIFFTGLNILTPAADNSCFAYVHNSSNPHTLSIEVRRKRPGKPDVVIMRHHGRLQFTEIDPFHNSGLVISAQGLGPGEKGVKAYNGAKSAQGAKLSDSFSLKALLGVVPEIDAAKGTPGVLIDHGILYTADKVAVRAQFVAVEGGAVLKTLTEVPTIIGANIYLDQQNLEHHVTLFWKQQGQEVHLNLFPSENFTYEIYVTNEPLFIPDDPNAPAHGEFAEYFKMLPNVPRANQIELEFIDVPPERGSNRSPCMSILGGG